MLYSDFTSKQLALEEICLENIESKENKIEITFSLARKKLLTRHFSKLKPEEKQQVNVMLYASAMLSLAYVLKEKFFEVLDEKDKAADKKLFF